MTASLETVTAEKARALLAQGGLDAIDVRDARDFASGHVPGARNVPLDVLRSQPTAHVAQGPVLFVCQRGVRSETAAKVALAAGLGDVYSLEGGLTAWVNAGYPLDRVQPTAPQAAEETTAMSCPLPEPGLELVVGKNVRALRDARGLSLDVLARLSDLSRNLLGQIELGKTSPSVGVVWKLARAFDVPFSELLVNSVDVSTTVLRGAGADRLEAPDGRFASRALFPLGRRPDAEFYQLYLAPHSSEDAHAHQPGTRENLVVASGSLQLTVNDRRFELATGDAILFNADVPHSYVNPSKEPCIMYLVMTYAGRAH